jgi:hypothetical protein
LGAVALGIGLSALSDNSFLTHLATGRVIVDDWHIPRSDLYTFTAHGEPWVVQSWLASLLYGLAEEVAGLGGVRALMGVTTVAIFAASWRLARPARSLLPRAAIGALVIGVGIEGWSERPLLLGLLAFALTVLAAEESLDPRWLVPVGWVWVNSHGSFPLGLAYLVVVLVGRRLDGEPDDVERRALAWLAGGVLLGAVNPLGPRLLVFPIELLQRQDILRNVVEWRAPLFQNAGQRVFLLQVLLVLLALVRRPSYRRGLVAGAFLAAALLGSRNVAVSSIAFVPLLAEAAPSIGTLRADARAAAGRLLGAMGLVALVLVAVASLRGPNLELDAYPVATLERLERRGIDLDEVRMVAPDRVGNLIGLREGPGRAVFFDDRFDLFREDVVDDAFALLLARPESLRVLERHRIDLALTPEEWALSSILAVSPEWRRIGGEEGWVLHCRRGATLGGRAGAC